MSKCLSYIFCCFGTKPKLQRNQILAIKPKTLESDGNTYLKEYEWLDFLRNERLKRQSFDKRICDDLCEVLLQYLSLEDKVRLECVSNQFQRAIFEKQFDLNIESVLSFDKSYNDTKLDWIAFKSLLKKCTNFRSINFIAIYSHRYSGFESNEITRIISLLNKYCHHLNRFNFYDFEIKCETHNKFIDKFGPQLVSMDGINWKNESLLKSFPNIKELSIDCISGFLRENHLKNLKKISIKLSEYDLDELNSYLDRHKSLKYLDLNINSWINTSFKNTLNKISKLKHLIHLRINMPFVFCKQLYNSWKKAFHDCIQLKSLDICYMITENDSSLFGKFEEVLKETKRLKRLKIRFLNTMQSNSVPNSWFSAKDLKEFLNISHLILDFIRFLSLNENFWTEIYKIIPNVQYLKIKKVFKTEEGSTQMADNLCRLSKLETLKLKVNNELICNQIKAKVIEKCKKIRIIDIEVKELNQ